MPDTGRVIYRWKGGFKHTGIMIGKDEYGTRHVIHNIPPHGVIVQTLEQFNNGQESFYAEVGCDFYADLTVWRAWNDLGKNYHIIDFNCQHFTSKACTGKKKSEDLNAVLGTVALVAVGGVLLGAILSRK